MLQYANQQALKNKQSAEVESTKMLDIGEEPTPNLTARMKRPSLI